MTTKQIADGNRRLNSAFVEIAKRGEQAIAIMQNGVYDDKVERYMNIIDRRTTTVKKLHDLFLKDGVKPTVDRQVADDAIRAMYRVIAIACKIGMPVPIKEIS